MTSRLIACALVASAITVAVRSAELSLKPLGELHYKAVGEAMVFTCEVVDDDDERDYNLRWFDPKGVEIADKTGRRYVEEEGSTKKLYITVIETSDEGTYKCSANLGESQPSEKSASLKLFKEITFDSAVSPQHPRIHSDALIKCVVSGQPIPVVSWRYKGQRLTIGPNTRFTKANDGLMIRNATLADNGDYTCRAEVEADGRYDEKKILVEVHIPPKMTNGPGKVEGVEGDEISMSCKATGLPSPQFEFSKGNVPLESSDRIHINKSTGVIHFKPLMKSDEDQIYSCTATNDVGSESANGELRVLVKPSVTQFSEVVQEERKAATLICLARGDPAPKITFLKGQEDVIGLSAKDDNSRITVKDDGSGRAELTITNLTPQDAGNYVCLVNNSVGHNSSSAKLTVEYKPIFSVEQVTTEHIWSGKIRNISCRPAAEPRAVIEWQRHGVALGNNGTFSTFNKDGVGYLQITVREQDQSWIYGIYKCVATNRLGSKEVDIDLKRASVPDAPKSVSLKTKTPTAVVINVEPPEDDGGMPVNGYRVEYNDVSNDFKSVHTDGDNDVVAPPYNTEASGTAATDADGSEIEIESLKPSTTYILRVKAKNEVGVGTTSYTLNVTTEAIRAPYPLVINSSPHGQSALNYHVTWNKPNNGGRPIVQYELKIRKVKVIDKNTNQVDPQDSNWREMKHTEKPENPTNHFKIDNLDPDSHYQLIIRAQNDVGWSEYSPHFLFHTAPATEEELHALQQSSSSVGTAVVIVFIVLFVAVMALDLTCFFTKRRGFIFMTIYQRFSSAQNKKANKDLALEEGEKQQLTGKNDDGDKVERGNEDNGDADEKVKLTEINETKTSEEDGHEDALQKNKGHENQSVTSPTA